MHRGVKEALFSEIGSAWAAGVSVVGPFALASATAVIFVTAHSPFALAEDERDDPPVNVSVATKRASIGSRSLPRLAELAEKHSPNVRKALDDLRVAELQMLNARTVFFPTLDIDITHGWQDTHPTVKAP